MDDGRERWAGRAVVRERWAGRAVLPHARPRRAPLMGLLALLALSGARAFSPPAVPRSRAPSSVARAPSLVASARMSRRRAVVSGVVFFWASRCCAAADSAEEGPDADRESPLTPYASSSPPSSLRSRRSQVSLYISTASDPAPAILTCRLSEGAEAARMR